MTAPEPEERDAYGKDSVLRPPASLADAVLLPFAEPPRA